MVNPDKLVAARLRDRRRAPDPTTVLFITGQDRLGAFWGDSASLLFATRLFAALLSLPQRGLALHVRARPRARAAARVRPRAPAHRRAVRSPR